MMEEMADEEKVSFELFKYIIWIICEVISVCYLLLLILCDTVTSDRKSTRLNSSHPPESRMPSSA